MSRNFRRSKLTLVPVLLVLLLVLPACSEGPSAQANAADPSSFAGLEPQLNKITEQLRELLEKFQTASPAEQVEIARQHDALAGELKTLLPKVQAAAESELKTQPDAASAQKNFLYIMVSDRIGSDDYEEADRLARLLLDQQVNLPRLRDMAGMAAFMTNDFDRAAKLFGEAAEEGTLSDLGRSFRSQIAYYKKLWKEEQAFRAAEAEADDLPRVKFETNKGDIVLELFENEAPNTVANLISLVDKKYYDGVTFHRVLPRFMAQGGCPDGTGGGGPGYTIRCECLKQPHRKHFRGSLSMAKQEDPHTGGSQFFLCFAPAQQLDGMHTVFGRVIEGLDVLAELQRRNPLDRAQLGIQPDKILKATVLRRRDHEYQPETVPDPGR